MLRADQTCILGRSAGLVASCRRARGDSANSRDSHMKIRFILPLQLLLLSFTGVARAQNLQALQVGDRIRVQISPSDEWRLGRFEGRSNDTLWIGRCDDCMAGRVPLGRINELDLSEGLPRSRSRQVIYSSLIGLTVGAIGGGIAGHAQHAKSNCQDGLFCGSEGTVSAVVYGSIGIVLGAALGAVLPTPRERWRKIFSP